MHVERKRLKEIQKASERRKPSVLCKASEREIYIRCLLILLILSLFSLFMPSNRENATDDIGSTT